jgi:hypothetical protein
LLLLVDVVPEPDDDGVEEVDELLPDDELSLPASFFAVEPFDDPPDEEPERLSVR